MIFVFLCLTSLNMIISRFIHIAEDGIIPFFLMAEKEMATHSGILAWRIPWTEEPGGLQSTGLQESDTTERQPPPGPIFHCMYIPLLLYPFLW